MIRYKEGYLYQATDQVSRYTGIIPPAPIVNRYFSLDMDGLLTLYIGFAWDGATWCPEWLVPKENSAMHDALCQCLRLRLLDYDFYAPLVHGLLRTMQVERRGKAAAWLVYYAVTLARGGHPDNAEGNPERCDPDPGNDDCCIQP